MGFTTQAYYKWLKNTLSAREIEERELIGKLHELHEEDPEGRYRVLADDLEDAGYQVSERRIWRLCRKAGIRSVISKRQRKHVPAGIALLLTVVQQNFTADQPHQLWLTDITERHTSEEKLYLCAIKDVFSNRIVGYSIGSRMKAHLAVNPVEMAVAHRGYPRGVKVHSDRGSQFQSRKFTRALERHGLVGSMGRVGAAGDNAAMESFFSLLQKNVLDRRWWSSRQQLRLSIVGWLEGKYNRKRKQRGLGKTTPIQFEATMIEFFALAA